MAGFGPVVPWEENIGKQCKFVDSDGLEKVGKLFLLGILNITTKDVILFVSLPMVGSLKEFIALILIKLRL